MTDLLQLDPSTPNPHFREATKASRQNTLRLGVRNDVPEQAFYMVGSIDEVLEKAKTVESD